MSPVFVRWVAAFVTCLMLAAGAAASELPREARPGMWRVERDGHVLYLLGSIHLLPPETTWLTPEISAARAKAEVFVFEAPLTDADTAMTRFVARHGRLQGGRTLRDLLGEREFERLEQAAWIVQYPPRLLDGLRPWLASVYLELHAYLKLGFSPFFGVDHVIERDARQAGASVAYLETVEEQLSYFLKIPPAEELRYLRATVRDIHERPSAPLDLVRAWASGDAAAIQRVIDEGMASTPILKSQILTARNRKWMPLLEAMLKSGKVHFVTVGAAHLTGSSGVVALFRARGYQVTGP